ncbi:TonB-dependent receptor [Flavobacterium capsici]|uniref:TonB-dependent receptor n=1 Tax=Flavobacterium capsici TaxID=3075618 RepID=A0AA96F4A1_9FLAO|nr:MULTISPECIES: TonB-dependent receptor [unclassified Flavobacterium]WNM18742.1 TonB-dependent receptor [Flavobacterium sp. PMR2A8]WNM22793.1 TonB-dependent receptor [Flavobacterium sp. PMTSA4]
MRNLKYIVIITLFSNVIFAQKKDENIGTEVVNVVKPYSPTISDAFKVKETPSFDDDETSKKENIQYNIFSFPVASTFTPSKGRAANVEKSATEKIFKNYLTLAAGNYGTIQAELFVTENVSNTDYFGGMLRHSSSQGGIKDVILDDKFYNTSLDLTYGSRTRALTWNADAGYQHQVYNWYGIFPSFFDQTTIDGIDEQQTYHNLYLGGRLSLGDSFLKESTLKFSRFWDAFGSAENRFVAKPNLEFDIIEEKINVGFVVDYISGTFDKTYNGGGSYKYGYTNFGVTPSVKLQKDDLSVNAGVGLFYSSAQESGESKFFIYPQVVGSYKVVGDLMIAYAGLEGTLKQNSYKEFVDQNFFLSPTIFVAPTDQKYDVFLGLKGKLANSVSYNLRASYLNEENKPLFKSNGYEESVGNEGYHYGNSFNVAYDRVKTLSFFGELKADFSKNVSFGINGTFSSFNTDAEAEAWNLPSLNLAANLDVNITPKWYAGTKIFFVGERKDFMHVALLTNPAPEDKVVTLDSYFDLNAHVGYKHNERLTFFLKGNNLANQDYQRWLNFPVQGLQVLVGASYKFDF